MDFDQTMSNDTMKSTASNDGKISTFGNTFQDSSSIHPVQDITIQSLISTSMIQNHQSMEQVANGVGE